MKIRIKDNSIRLRLTKTDVANLKKIGLVECQTVITANNVFRYKLKVDNSSEIFSASFDMATITVYIPLHQATILTETDEITVKGWQENSEENKLFILVEKDLQCLDPTHEDQSDMYHNPNSSC